MGNSKLSIVHESPKTLKFKHNKNFQTIFIKTDANSENAQVIKMPIIDVISNRPVFLPLTVPKQYIKELERFHGDPFVWFSGQILNFLMRFNENFTKTVKQKRDELGFETPCVG